MYHTTIALMSIGLISCGSSLANTHYKEYFELQFGESKECPAHVCDPSAFKKYIFKGTHTVPLDKCILEDTIMML